MCKVVCKYMKQLSVFHKSVTIKHASILQESSGIRKHWRWTNNIFSSATECSNGLVILLLYYIYVLLFLLLYSVYGLEIKNAATTNISELHHSMTWGHRQRICLFAGIHTIFVLPTTFKSADYCLE